MTEKMARRMVDGLLHGLEIADATAKWAKLVGGLMNAEIDNVAAVLRDDGVEVGVCVG